MSLSVGDVAGIVFAETRDLQPDPRVGAAPAPAEALTAFRNGLAWIVQQSDDGVFFAPPEEPTTPEMGDEVVMAAWRDCVAAAKTPTTPANQRSNVAYFAPVDPVTDPSFQGIRENTPWLRTAINSTAVGAALQDGTPIKLWLMEAKTVSGRFPRTNKTLDHALEVLKPGFTNPVIGGLIFVALIGLLILPAYQTWTISQDALTNMCSSPKTEHSGATRRLHQECLAKLRTLDGADTRLVIAIAADDGKAEKQGDVKKAHTDVEDAKDSLERTVLSEKCDALTTQEGAACAAERTKLSAADSALATAKKTTGNAASTQDELDKAATVAEAKKSLAASVRGGRITDINIFSKCVLSFLGILGLMSLISYGMRSQWLGFLVDDRGRMSLSRFQFVAWTLVILAAYWIAAAWNLGLTEAVDSSVLPSMSMDLWILLGIVTASPLASNLIIGVKKQGADPANTNTSPPNVARRAIGNEGPVDVRKEPQSSSFLDLFIGEEVSNRSHVDISRVQQFIFTLVTLFAFIALTLQMFSNLDGGVRIVQLPPLDASLVGLLAISHAAYLTAKTLPKGKA